MKQEVSIIWFRRDLRMTDNAALYYALKGELPVVPIFIFDRDILDDLEDKEDKRVEFIHNCLEDMNLEFKKLKTSLQVYYGFPHNVFTNDVLKQFNVKAVYTNHDYEPYGIKRDKEIRTLLQDQQIPFYTFKDHVIFEKDEVLKDNNEPYTVFTPYSRKWKEKLTAFYLSAYPVKKYHDHFLNLPFQEVMPLNTIGFKKNGTKFPSKEPEEHIGRAYHNTRDYPGLEDSTSRMGIHLRFGTISIRALADYARQINDTYFNELIWREFYQMILWHFPRVGEGQTFKPEYENIRWRNNEKEFMAWCAGMTGYPIVDAGMRQLNATGYMHNRVRMITASFLTKHLLIDWRWGEAYFAATLLDYELASNNGGWQWASGSGCDAAPYFRIFNPYLQTQKFDKDHVYINRWIPELNELSYPQPIVVHEEARKRALEVYAAAVGSEGLKGSKGRKMT